MKTREVFWNFEPWMEVAWYVLAFVSILVFAYGVARPLSRYTRSRDKRLPRAGELPGRLRRAVRLTVSHALIAQRNPAVGWAHRGIFYGFVVLFIGTVILAINTDFTEPVFGWRFFEGDFYLGYSLVLDIFGLLLILGLLAMGVRRLFRPSRLDYRRPDRSGDELDAVRRGYVRGDWVFLGLLVFLVLTGYLLEGTRIAMDDPGYDEFSPAGWAVAQAFGAIGTSDSALGELRMAQWWIHGLVALALVASIPYTKAVHMLASFASTVLYDPDAGRRLPGTSDADAAEPIGYRTLDDFTVKHLLDLDACTKCGRCHEVCPANAVGLPLSPRDVVLELRETAREETPEGVGGVLGALFRGDRESSSRSRQLVAPDRVSHETIWSCMQCNACVEVCPVEIEQAPIINQLRRAALEEGELDPDLQATLQTIHKKGNSLGARNRRRGSWTDELDFDVPDARSQAVETLWFLGDYASFDPRNQAISRKLAELLSRAGADFGILYDGEINAGNDVRRVGEEGLFTHLASENIASISECEFRRIVTSDPHSLNTLKNEYPELGGEWEVVHHTVLLQELLEDGNLEVAAPIAARVTYHDPCFLGRMNGGYEAPRRVLHLLGCELVEMPRNRENSFCCGAGGGRIWMPDSEQMTERPSEQRIREATALDAVGLFVVSCPKDVTMYEDAIKTTDSGDRIELRELTELVHRAVVGAESS